MSATPHKPGGISSQAVLAKTGKTWDEWLAILDAEKAQALPHKQIAALLSEKYGVPAWWCQMLTVGYEQARGLRAVHQTARGYTAGVSRTFNAPLAALYHACADETLRSRWLGRKHYTVTQATPTKSVRIAWGKGGATRVDFGLYAKGKNKSQIAIQHEKLGSADEVAQMKTFWSGALDKLAKVLQAHA